ncbi:MAG: DUF58 domain-containing protein [Synechococcales bacterium]|nr:DUF58 domain-containing protein [Synechococcales bacterium]
MIPTLRVYLLLLAGAGVATLLSIFWKHEASLTVAIGLMLLWDVLVLGVMVLDGLLGRKCRVTVQREPLYKLSIGRDNPITLQVTSQSTTAELQIYDASPLKHFEISQPILKAKLPANHTETLTYTAKPTMRGEYKWGDIQVRQLSPGKLCWMDWKIPHSTKAEVFPDLVGLRSLSIRLTLQSTGAMKQARRMGIGTEFAELRDYATGDDPRLIDWKATARRSRPLVRVLEPEQEQTLIILLDRGRLMTAQVQGLQRFDWGLNATLGLAMAGLRRGDRVGVGVFDRALHTWIPPQRGQAHLNHLLERLTPIQPELLEPDYLGAVNAIVSQQSRRALVVVITDVVDTTASAELLVALTRLAPRYLPFCVTLRDAQIDKQAHQFTSDVTSNYARAVALDLLAQRQVAFAELKRQGVLVLDAPASQISDELVDRYLQLKLRNQL